MSFAQDTGYTPRTFEAIMSSLREGINEQFTLTYTVENFVGTGWYKYLYPIAQKIQENEIKASEIFLKYQEYIEMQNDAIQRPSVSNPGIVEALTDAGYIAAVKPPLDADAGKIFIAIDVDDGEHAVGLVTITSYANLVSGTDDSITIGATVFTAQVGSAALGDATFQAATSNDATATSLAAQINAHATAGALVKATANGAIVSLRAVHGGTAGNAIALGYTNNDGNVGATKSGTALAGGTASATYAAKKLEIATLIKDFVAGGIVSQGTEVEAIVLSNGQSFDYKFNLPNPIPVILRLTIVESENSGYLVPDDEDIRQIVFDKIAASYRLGLNFEPQRYFAITDAPYAATVLLEWSSNDGGSWHSTVYDAEYYDKFTFGLEDIEVVVS